MRTAGERSEPAGSFAPRFCDERFDRGEAASRTRGVKSGRGTGFVAALPEADAEAVVEDSEDARIVGEGEECVAVRGLELQ